MSTHEIIRIIRWCFFGILVLMTLWVAWQSRHPERRKSLGLKPTFWMLLLALALIELQAALAAGGFFGGFLFGVTASLFAFLVVRAWKEMIVPMCTNPPAVPPATTETTSAPLTDGTRRS